MTVMEFLTLEPNTVRYDWIKRNSSVMYHHMHVIIVNINHNVLDIYININIQLLISLYHHWLTEIFATF